MNRNLTGTILVLLAASGYALLPIFAKLAYSTGIGALDLLIWRFVIAAGLMWLAFPVWRRQARLGGLTRRDVLTLLGLGALFAIVALMAFLALERIPATLFSMIFYTYPAIVALISLALGERLPGTAWLALGLALAGCTLTALTASEALVIDDPLDLAFPLLNAAAYAVYLVIAGRRTGHIRGLASGVLSMTGSLGSLLIAGLVVGVETPPQPQSWLVIAGLALFSTVFTIMAMFSGIARIGAPRAAILSTIEPPLTVLLAALVLGERAGVLQYAGGALILASVFLLYLPGRGRAEVAEAVEVAELGQD